MGDGQRKDLNSFQGPDGCLCDAAFVMLNGGSQLGHGYFEATPNPDAGCFRVTDDAANRMIVQRMLTLKGAAAPGEASRPTPSLFRTTRVTTTACMADRTATGSTAGTGPPRRPA